MHNNFIYTKLIDAMHAGQKLIALLIDPDKVDFNKAALISGKAKSGHVDLILIGGSLLMSPAFGLTEKLKKMFDIPVVLFPGSLLQIDCNADAILLLSLISGRNADFLIGNHVVAAPVLKKSGIETISCGYILVDCGGQTSVSYMSNTMPIPHQKTDIAIATALAGAMIGMKTIYLEGGSGASFTVDTEMVRQVKENIDIPLFVGGGIKTPEQAKAICLAGADIVVVGTAVENQPDVLDKLSEAVHSCSFIRK